MLLLERIHFLKNVAFFLNHFWSNSTYLSCNFYQVSKFSHHKIKSQLLGLYILLWQIFIFIINCLLYSWSIYFGYWINKISLSHTIVFRYMYIMYIFIFLHYLNIYEILNIPQNVSCVRVSFPWTFEWAWKDCCNVFMMKSGAYLMFIKCSRFQLRF